MATKNFVVRNGLTVNDIDVIDANGNITATTLTVNGVEITGAGEVANAYLTSTYTTNTTFQSALANTNLAISDRMQVANVATVISTAVSNLIDAAPGALDTLNELAAAIGDDANFSVTITNSLASRATWSALTATNTAIRTLVDDRLQVANAVSLVTPYLEVANAAATYATIDTVNSNLANTNAYIAYVAANAGEVSNAYLTSTFTTNTAFQSALANTNAYIASVAASSLTLGTTAYNEYSFVATENQTSFSGTDKFGKSLSYNSGEIAVFLNGVKLLANTDYTATNGTTVVLSANTNASDIVEIQSYTKNAGVSNAEFQAWVANTNAYIAASGLIGTVANTYLQAYIANTNLAINDRMQVANVASAISTAISNLVDTAPSTLDTLNELAAALGDDANFATTVTNSLSTKASWSALTATNTAIRTLVSDRLQVANASATYATISTFNSALANTNAYIASVAASGGEVSSSYLTSTYVSNTTFQSFVANTNAYIASSGGGGGETYVNNLGIDNKTYTASNGQTTFSVSYANSNVLVYRNGIKISPNEYTANNGTTVVLSTATNEDDAVDLIGYTTDGGGVPVTTGKAIAMAIVFGG